MSTQQRKTVRQTALQAEKELRSKAEERIKALEQEARDAFESGVRHGKLLMAQAKDAAERVENATKGGRWRDWVKANPARTLVILIAGGIAVYAFAVALG